MCEDRPNAVLTRLAETLHEHGIEANVREWPGGPVLSVLVNLSIQHSDGCYRWCEGLTDHEHPDSDPDGAAEQIAILCHRLQGPSFTSSSTKSGDGER